MNRKPRLLLMAFVTVAGLTLIALLAVRFWPYRYHGFLLEPTKPVADFELVGPNSQPVKLSDFRGKLTVLYFGYTYCPDVCPTTLAELAQGLKGMGRRGERVQVVMVTVDPERDTPESLAQYMAHFDPALHRAERHGRADRRGRHAARHLLRAARRHRGVRLPGGSHRLGRRDRSKRVLASGVPIWDAGRGHCQRLSAIAQLRKGEGYGSKEGQAHRRSR